MLYLTLKREFKTVNIASLVLVFPTEPVTAIIFPLNFRSLFIASLFKIKSTTGQNALEDSPEPETAPEPEPQASENVDLAPSEEPQPEQPNQETEETQPSIRRDDDGGEDDKIKFKR